MSSEEGGDAAEGYVHTPDAVETDAESGGAVAETDADRDPETFGREGWVLVAAVVVAVLVIPGLIYLWPAGPARVGAHFRFFMLVLPLVPAVILGLVAVWSMRTPR